MPWVSLILSFVGGLVFLLPFPSWHALVGLVTGASVLMYAGAPLSLAAFRRQVPEAVRPYRLAGAAVWAPLGFIIANFIIYWSGFIVIWKLGICIVIGYVIIGICMIFDPQRPKLFSAQSLRSASWLPVYLIGMGIISWLGQYSGQSTSTPLAPTNTNTIGLWYDLLVIAAFSLVIYFWAVAVRLPREEMLELVSAQSGEEDVPPADPLVAQGTAPPGGPRSARSGVLRLPVKHGPFPLTPKTATGDGPASSGTAPAPRCSRRHRAEAGAVDRARARVVRGQPPAPVLTPTATRLTSRNPGRCGCQASTTWPGRTRRVRHASSQSPGRSAGVMDSSATATRRTGQRFGRARTFTSALDE